MIINNPQANNVFKDFPDFKLGQPPVGMNSGLLSQKQDTVDVKNTSVDSPKLASVKVSDAESSKKGKGGVIAATVGSTVVLAGMAALFLSNGFSSGLYRKINKISEKLTEKIDLSTKSRNSLEKIGLVFAKGFRKFLSGMQAASNFNAFKDSLIQKLFNTNKFTARIAEKTTNLFKKFSYESVYSAYDKVHLDTDAFCADLKYQLAKIRDDKSIDLNQLIEVKKQYKPLGVVLDELEQHLRGVKASFETGFGKSALLARKDIREKNVEGLLDDVWDDFYNIDGGIFNVEANGHKFKVYRTNELRKMEKNKLGGQIDKFRKNFTNNVEHNYNFMKTKIYEVSPKLKLDDDESRVCIKDILKNIEDYKNCKHKGENDDRAKVAEKIKQNIEKFKNLLNSSTDYKDSGIEEKLDEIIATLVNDKKGQLQEVMSLIAPIYKHSELNKNTNLFKVFNEKVFDSFEGRAHKITKGINKATELESEDLHEKCAEFAVGSAPSDLVSFLLPVGVAGYAISRGKNKDERVSATLTAGIPILGSIGTMMYGTVRMFTGAKNIGFGLGTGLILGILGNTCDKLYKDYKEKRSFTKMAVEAYRNNALLSQSNKNNLI